MGWSMREECAELLMYLLVAHAALIVCVLCVLHSTRTTVTTCTEQ